MASTFPGFDPRRPFSALELFRQADADIYHSQEPSFGTYLAQRAMPDRKHVVTFRDYAIEKIGGSNSYIHH